MSMHLIRASLLTLLLISVFGEARAVNGGSTKNGVCWGLALDGYPITDVMLDNAQKEVRLAPAQIIVFFLQWPQAAEDGKFPGESLDAIAGRGAVPCLTWEPMYYKDGKEITIPYEKILKGDYDAYIASFALAARKWKRPLIVRFAHEMNLERYHWGTDKDGYGPRSPEIYRRMFRYVVSAFRGAGASNVLWAFCPNAESLPDPSIDPVNSWNEVANYFPGDDFVDLVGTDGYNWGVTQTRERTGWDSRWRSFPELFRPVVNQLRAIAPGKPLFVFETSTVVEGGDKELWIREAVRTAREWDIRGLVWFQVQKEQDWRFRIGITDSCAASIRPELTCKRDWLKQKNGK